MLHAMRSLVLIVVAGLVATACGSTASEQSDIVLAAPSPSPSPSPTASGGGATPASAGAVPEAGVIYVWGADDGIYRYDGTTGALTLVWRASTLSRDSAYGPYVLGRHGGITLLKWDGTTQQVCGGGSWSVVSTRGQCAWMGAGADTALYTDSAEGGHGATLPRMLLPADWGLGSITWDWNGLELAIIRNGPRPEPIRGHQTLWVMDLRHGTLQKVFDSTHDTSFLFGVKWSFDRRISFWESATTSASAGADGAFTTLHVVNVDTGTDLDLGTTLQARAWAQWSLDGRLAFVSGGGRETYENKQLVVVGQDGTRTVVAGSRRGGATTALAPMWEPIYGQMPALAWIEAPTGSIEASPDYFRGVGPTAQRVTVVRTSAGDVRLSCPGLVTEGVRLSTDAKSALLLCRTPGVDQHALQLWYAPLGGTPRQLVTGLGDLGFGYYGLQPSLLDITAWSLADR